MFDLAVFHSEVLDSLQRGAKEGVKVDNLILEVNSSRYAYAISPDMVIQSVSIAILTIAGQTEDGGLTGPKLLKEIQKNMKAFEGILLKYCKSANSQVIAAWFWRFRVIFRTVLKGS